MRVAVFSNPRTCSSYVIQIVSDVLNIQNYNELYTQDINIEDLPSIVETKLYNTDNYAIKFMSTYFSSPKWLDINNINWDIFDYIIFTERDDLCSHIASWYAIFGYNQDLNNKLVRGEEVVENIKEEFFENEIQSFKYIFETYKTQRNILIEKYPNKCMILKYEMFQKPVNEYLPELRNITKFDFTETHVFKKIRKVDYKKIFPNYDKLEEIVKQWNFSYDN